MGGNLSNIRIRQGRLQAVVPYPLYRNRDMSKTSLFLYISDVDPDDERHIKIEIKNEFDQKTFEGEGYLTFKDMEELAAAFDRAVRSW